MDAFDFDLAAETYSALLGQEISAQRLWDVCTEVGQIERDFNIREGLTSQDDTLPPRFIDKPIPDGPAKGTTIDINKLVRDYYREKGWEA
jgi:aldehyde:ferredoxin oxidoreductase